MQASSQPQPSKTATIPRWEYLVIMAVTARGLGQSSTTYACDNKEIQKALKEHKSIDSALCFLGASGWELVAAAPGFGVGCPHLYFKHRCV